MYSWFTVPFGKVWVVIVGGTGGTLMTIDNILVSSPAAFDAFTLKLKVAAVNGVPEIVPSVERVNPVGSCIPSVVTICHVIGLSPVAVRV